MSFPINVALAFRPKRALEEAAEPSSKAARIEDTDGAAPRAHELTTTTAATATTAEPTPSDAAPRRSTQKQTKVANIRANWPEMPEILRANLVPRPLLNGKREATLDRWSNERLAPEQWSVRLLDALEKLSEVQPDAEMAQYQLSNAVQGRRFNNDEHLGEDSDAREVLPKDVWVVVKNSRAAIEAKKKAAQ